MIQDRWIYPFNGSPGFRGDASLFSTAIPGFNFRDGTMGLRFDTDSLVDSGFPLDAYDFSEVQLVTYHSSGTFAWDTRMGDEIEIFGFGVDDSFTSFTEETWNEFSPYQGDAPGPPHPFIAREPHPLNIDAASTMSNVSEIPGAEPWGFGEPTYGTGAGEYTPGAASNQPFKVVFTLKLDNDRVKEYVQQGLSDGFVNFILSSSIQPPGPGLGPFPVLLTKEFMGGAYKAKLVLKPNPIHTLTTAESNWDLYR